MAPTSKYSPMEMLIAPLKLVTSDVRAQIPLLLALLYYPDKLRSIIPDRIYPWISSPRVLQGLKVLVAYNITTFLNNKLSQYVINNWKKDAKFVTSQEIVVITGASSGIGELMAKDFATRGVKVINLDIKPPKTPQPGVHYYQVDITSSAQLASAATELRKAHGEPTVLINNAGVGHAFSILDEPENKIRQTFEVNTFAHFLTVKEFLPAMIKKNHGHVVTVASMAAYVTVASLIDYTCTKASAVAFHEGVASELKNRYNAPDVRTTLVTPSWIRTPLIEALVNDPTFPDPVLDPEEVSSEIVQQILSGRSAHIVLPKKHKFATGLRAWPYWMQESLRNQKGSLMDLRVRYGGKFKRDPRLNGESLDDLR